MLVNRLRLKKRFQSALAFVLVLWCAGAGCMLVTYAHSAAMADMEAASTQAGGMISTGASASASAHSCCKARHSSQHSPTMTHERAPVAAELALPESSNPANAMSCCPMTSGTFVVTARQSFRDDRASEATDSNPPALLLAGVYAMPRAVPLRLPTQNQTYLRCCVFLI